MKLTSWKKHTNLIGTTHYVNIEGTNWNAQVTEYQIAGTNQKNVHHSKKIYQIYINDGYGNCSVLFSETGLVRAKMKAGLKLLERHSEYNKAS